MPYIVFKNDADRKHDKQGFIHMFYSNKGTQKHQGELTSVLSFFFCLHCSRRARQSGDHLFVMSHRALILDNKYQDTE